jgi:hypothetical protein
LQANYQQLPRFVVQHSNPRLYARVSVAMSRLFLEHLAGSDPQAEHVVIRDQAGF